MLKHFGVGEAEIFESFGVSFFSIWLVENIKFFVAEPYAAGAVFATSEVVRKIHIVTICTILAEVAVITGVAVDAFVAELAAFAESAVRGVGERAGIFAVVSLLAVAGVETHVTILGDSGDIAVVAIFAGTSPGATLRGFHVERAEIGDEGGGGRHVGSVVEGVGRGKKSVRAHRFTGNNWLKQAISHRTPRPSTPLFTKMLNLAMVYL